MNANTCLEPERFKRSARRDAAAGLALRKLAPAAAVADEESIEPDDRRLRFVLSTGQVDREGDRIDPAGWQLEAYRRNPVVLWAHDHRQPPVARAREVAVRDGRLTALAEFTPREVNPFGHMTFELYAAGFLNAVSVGFRPLSWDWSDEAARRDGIDFTRQELLEFSCVPVPANPEALLQARAKGIDTGPLADWAERQLDAAPAAEDEPLARPQLERLRRAACVAPATVHDLAALARRVARLEAAAEAAARRPANAAVVNLVEAALTRRIDRLMGRS